MTFRNRKGTDPEQRFDEIEKELSLENLGSTEILTSFPEATEIFGIFVVDSGGTRYLQVNGKGGRWRAALTSF